MSVLWLDLRYAVRQIRGAPAFAALVIGMLALGIGASTAAFTLLDRVLLRPFPYPDPGRLVGLREPSAYGGGEVATTWNEFRFLQRHTAEAVRLAASTEVGFNLIAGDRAERIDALHVSQDYFQVLGVLPALGRTFDASEDAPTGPRTVILSHGLWQRRFGGSRGILGATVTLNGRPFTIIGVMPRGFVSQPAVEAWTTLAQVGTTIGGGQNLSIIGRLRDGVPIAAAGRALDAARAGFRQEFTWQGEPPQATFIYAPWVDLVTDGLRTPMLVLAGAIALVLLIACANVAGLLLGRSVARSRELALRVALGATARQLVRQQVTEGVVLALLASVLGVLGAHLLAHGLIAIAPDTLPGGERLGLNGRALAFALLVSLLVGAVCGLLPALQAARRDPNAALKDGAGSLAGSRRHGQVRAALVAGEVALSLILLVGAGLLIRTFANLLREDPGFEVEGVAVAPLWLSDRRFLTPGEIARYYDGALARVRAIPGVTEASFVESGLPLARAGNTGMAFDGVVIKTTTSFRVVTPQAFAALRIPLRSGRLFTDADRAGAEPVAIVSEAFVRRLVPTGDPLGRILTVGGGGEPQPRRIVGVVGDVHGNLGQTAPPSVWLPSAQTPPGITVGFNVWFPIHVVARTTGDARTLAPLLARALQATDPRVPVGRPQAMTDMAVGRLGLQRFLMLVLVGFALSAVTLALTGLYGLMSYTALQSRREIGIRLALGAVPGRIVRLMLVRGMRPALLGTAIGLAGAFALTGVLRGLLFGVQPTDPRTLALGVAAIGVVAVLACALPARRAARVDPLVTMRPE